VCLGPGAEASALLGVCSEIWGYSGSNAVFGNAPQRHVEGRIVKKVLDSSTREKQSTAKLRRKTPEELLRECQAEEEAATRTGHLKVMLGYASGVGKTFRLLDEARRRRERGQDVVIGAVQPEVPPEAKPLLSKLEIIPLRRLDGGTAIDVDAILSRRPTVCFIDGLAYDNPPGAGNSTRWQDVQDLLRASIKVVGSINVQYVAELQDQIEAITGERKTETAPLSFLKNASEFEIVDAPPEEPIERSPEEQIEARNRDQRLLKLRELALVFAADVVDYQLNEYLECHGIHQHFGTSERILVCLTPRANLQEMIEEAQIVTDKFHCELIVAYVKQPNLSPEDQSALDARLAIASAAGAHIEILEGDDPADAILEFSRSRGVTQLYVGNKQRTGLSRLKRSPLEKLIWQGHGMDVRVFPQ
jgi:two-component system sensor histidine kinase KdpD